MWRTNSELVQAAYSPQSGSDQEGSWRTARISCGVASVETVEAVEGIVGHVEEQLTDGRAIVWCSAKCRGVLRRCLASLEERGDTNETVDEVAALETIWELCESVLLEEGASRTGWRLITWLRMHGIDWISEDEDYIAKISILRRLAAQGGTPEAWQPNNANIGFKKEEDSPFWQLFFRLILRGRTREAWTVLETHSRRSAIPDDWTLLAGLLRDMPQPPRVKTSAQQLTPAEEEEEMDALADGWKTYEESRRRWRRRLLRLGATLKRDDSGQSLFAVAPPLRLLFKMFESGTTGENMFLETPLFTTWEEQLLAALLYSPQPQWQHVDISAWIQRHSNHAQSNIELASAARQALLQAMLRGQGVSAVKAVYEVGADLTANASAFCLAKLCTAAGRLGDAPPLPVRGSQTSPDAHTLVAALGKELSEKLEACSHCVDSPWRLAERLLAAVDRNALPTLLRRLSRKIPRSDSDAVHLARACIRAGLHTEARLALVARGTVYAARARADYKQLRLAAAWYTKSDLLLTPAPALGNDNTSLEIVLAPDGHAEQLCAVLADKLRELLIPHAASSQEALLRTLDGPLLNERLTAARAAVLGITDGLEGRRLNLATHAAFLAKYTDLLDALRRTDSQITEYTNFSKHSLLLAELLLESPPPRRTFLPHLLRLVLIILRRDPVPAFSSDHILGIMHRLIELQPTGEKACITVLGDQDPGLSNTELADLRLALAETLTHALIAQNAREAPEAEPHVPMQAPREPFTASAEDLLIGEAATVPIFF